jgi:hypothetical protein
MKLKSCKPADPEVTARILTRIDEMPPKELLDFLTYRTPGIEETDMTGMFSKGQAPERTNHAKHPAKSG